MSAVPSSSTSSPVDTTFSSPGPTGLVLGRMRPLPSAVLVPARRPSTPSIRGTEKPQMSASSTPTV